MFFWGKKKKSEGTGFVDIRQLYKRLGVIPKRNEQAFQEKSVKVDSSGFVDMANSSTNIDSPNTTNSGGGGFFGFCCGGGSFCFG